MEFIPKILYPNQGKKIKDPEKMQKCRNYNCERIPTKILITDSHLHQEAVGVEDEGLGASSPALNLLVSNQTEYTTVQK